MRPRKRHNYNFRFRWLALDGNLIFGFCVLCLFCVGYELNNRSFQWIKSFIRRLLSSIKQSLNFYHAWLLEFPYLRLAKPKIVFHCEEQTDFTYQGSLTVEEGVEESLEESLVEVKDIYEEVSRLRLRVNRLNHLLGTNISDCPTIDLCKSDQILLTMPNEDHPEILQMQIASKKLAHQLIQLQPVRKAADVAIRIVRNDHCRNKKLELQLQNRIQELNSFKLKFEKYQGLCLQRFRFLEEEKYCGRAFGKYLNKSTELVKKNHNKLIIRNEYEPLRQDALKVIDNLRRASENLRDHLSDEITNKKQQLFQNI
ncbi:uncharacterized protein LOC119560157 [Drosophila subpulchrella]|uniref:uncharacterized protein LOC119560157 n=1 Tax=Drosophila subpulchrella TaxID=1486046 RepID=UPI0018A18C9F|nr:uncharacterized protein LOC119560157 [Drosophila subpulchrella]